jgi:hypothetical protein
MKMSKLEALLFFQGSSVAFSDVILKGKIVSEDSIIPRCHRKVYTSGRSEVKLH